jgi:protein-S-isoprenylcysteine O-methyltransferase Ste14
MPPETSAHIHPWKISDVVIFPLLALALAAEWLWPTGFGLPRVVSLAGGLAAAFAGLDLIRRSKRALDAADQPSLPGAPTTELVTSGPFRWSRNPNYLGAIIAMLGGALAVDSLWLIAAAGLTLGILTFWMIRPEERYLEDRFGKTYEDYASRTRRWL